MKNCAATALRVFAFVGLGKLGLNELSSYKVR
jgi:hypothetical protein